MTVCVEGGERGSAYDALRGTRHTVCCITLLLVACQPASAPASFLFRAWAHAQTLSCRLVRFGPGARKENAITPVRAV